MRIFLLFLFASILYIGSVRVAVLGRTFRLDSDYDSNFPIVNYVVDTIRVEHRFPRLNPYVSIGISTLGDPLSGVLYLPYLIPMLFWGIWDGWWVVIGLHALFAGIFMWMFLRSLGIRSSIAIWGGMLYMVSGSLAARVAAGHIEKVLSYPWYPLFFLFLVKRNRSIRSSVAIGAIMAIVFLTGDVYAVWYLAIFFAVILVIRLTGRERGGVIRETGIAASTFFVVGSMKLIPFFVSVLPAFSRYSVFDVTRGSIHAIFSFLPFIIPFGVSFYDRPIFQKLLAFWYNWYEYYVFIGIPMLFLFCIPSITKRKEVQVLLIFLAVGVDYIARGYGYSPLFVIQARGSWDVFRVPQRMYMPLSSVVIALIALCASSFKSLKNRSLNVFLWGSLLTTVIINGYQMTRAFEVPRRDEEDLVRELRARDSGDISVATFVCCVQTFLVAEKIRVINYYYGWLPKRAPRFVNTSGEVFDFSPLERTRPTYIIAPKDMSFGRYGYEAWFGEARIVVWRVSNLTNPTNLPAVGASKSINGEI